MRFTNKKSLANRVIARLFVFNIQTKPPAMPVDNKKGFSSSLVGIYKKAPMC